MVDLAPTALGRFATTKSTQLLLVYATVVRCIAIIYCNYHDRYITHLKFTDIDYHVYTNGSRAVMQGRSPFEDQEYRYPPAISLLFLPNLFIGENFGKILLASLDIFCGNLIYKLNVHQGVSRSNAKAFMVLWLFNPVTIAISTRGSFEPVINSLVLLSIYLLMLDEHFASGLIYGLSIHLKLYPVIYALLIYLYMVQRKPQMKNQAKIIYMVRTLLPRTRHLVFFSTACLSLLMTSYLSYIVYGHDYLEASFLYHLKRKDLQHNFSIYFYLFRLFPNHMDLLSTIAFSSQIGAVLTFSTFNQSFEPNKRQRLRKLMFGLFSTTFLFVSLNKVCTSQYFTWYLVFLPMILDSLKMDIKSAAFIFLLWLGSQACWLFFAYLYEYQKLDVLQLVGNSSIMFLMSNLWITARLSAAFVSSKAK